MTKKIAYLWDDFQLSTVIDWSELRLTKAQRMYETKTFLAQ